VVVKLSIPHGGAIPKGRLTEDGALPDKYNMEEMTTKSYPQRTEKNVIDSDGTVILTHGKLTDGSLLTLKKAVQYNKPILHLDMDKATVDEAVSSLSDFIKENTINILNVAGSRASKDNLIYKTTSEIVEGGIATDLGG